LDADHVAKGGLVAEEVRAELVANVWKIVVTEGQQVEDGDTLVILESMKMEIPVIAESSGTVSVKIAEGDVVQEGDLIAVIE
jgi:acetyl-CoA carboxylase biotin carboxyl carrier protein